MFKKLDKSLNEENKGGRREFEGLSHEIRLLMRSNCSI